MLNKLSLLVLAVVTAGAAVLFNNALHEPQIVEIERIVTVEKKCPVAMSPIETIIDSAEIPVILPGSETLEFLGPNASNIRLLPHRGRDGEIDGVRVSGLRRGTPLDEYFDNGDVLHEVNGIPLTNMQNLDEVRKSTKMNGGLVTASVMRRGKLITISYRFTV